MASRRFNLIFKDGCEYEVTLYGSGGIQVKSEFGGKILELGQYQTLDLLEILDRFRDELKATDKRYNNPIETIEEAERMQLEYNELKEIIKKNVREFINDKAFDTLSESEKCVLKQLMSEFTVRLALDITNTEMDKLDKMAVEE